MVERSRCSRAAGVILGATGAVLSAFAAITFVEALPLLLGSEGQHMADDAWLWMLIVVLPLAVSALATVVLAWWLWRGRRGARGLMVLWIVVATAICWTSWSAEMNVLSSLRRVVVESGRWFVSGRDLGVATPDGATYYGQLDNPTFWAPGLVVLAILGLLVILLVWVVSDLRDSRADRLRTA